MRRVRLSIAAGLVFALATLGSSTTRGKRVYGEPAGLTSSDFAGRVESGYPFQGADAYPPPLPGGESQILLGPADSQTPLTLFEPSVQTASARSVVCDGCGGGCRWQLMPQGVIYRSYLAGTKESRFRSVWNDEQNDGDIWDISLGGRVALVRYGPTGCVRPQGWELGMEGAGLVRLDRDSNMDVTATDYRFGIPLSWGDERRQVKLAYYHLSSHLGDEFLLSNPGFTRLNYSRDVLVLGYSLYPVDRWRVYGEIGYGVKVDVAKPWELQFGVEWAPLVGTGPRGEPFAAFNGRLREEVDYGGNFVAQAGWAWRRSPATGIFRVGVEYYNGKNDQFSFFDDSEQKVGFGIWYDY